MSQKFQIGQPNFLAKLLKPKDNFARTKNRDTNNKISKNAKMFTTIDEVVTLISSDSKNGFHFLKHVIISENFFRASG